MALCNITNGYIISINSDEVVVENNLALFICQLQLNLPAFVNRWMHCTHRLSCSQYRPKKNESKQRNYIKRCARLPTVPRWVFVMPKYQFRLSNPSDCRIPDYLAVSNSYIVLMLPRRLTMIKAIIGAVRLVFGKLVMTPLPKQLTAPQILSIMEMKNLAQPCILYTP